MTKPLFNPNFTISDNPPKHPDFAPGDWELMAVPPGFRRAKLRKPRLNNAILAAVLVAIALTAGALYFTTPAKSTPPADCDSEYEVFPEAQVTVIYKQTEECTQYRLEKLTRKLTTPLPPPVQPPKKIPDSLLEQQQ